MKSKMFAKYDTAIREPEREKVRRFESWQNSATVTELSSYLKSQDGFQLVGDGKDLILHFGSGVTPAEPERWEAAKRALALFEAALPDLYLLIDLRMIHIQRHPGYFGVPAFSQAQKQNRKG